MANLSMIGKEMEKLRHQGLTWTVIADKVGLKHYQIDAWREANDSKVIS
jgi:hypothetical protein